VKSGEKYQRNSGEKQAHRRIGISGIERHRKTKRNREKKQAANKRRLSKMAGGISWLASKKIKASAGGMRQIKGRHRKAWR